jgi:chromosome segregation ATPase
MKSFHFQDSDSDVATIASLLDGAKSILFLGGVRPGLPQLLEARGCVLSFVLSDPAQADEARVYAASVEIADLDRVDLAELLPGSGFNAVVFDGARERPREPWRAIDCASGVLRRDGFVLGLLPNVGHGAIRLALLKGELPSRQLDDFALRGFTLQSAHDLFARAGYQIERIDRTTAPIFGASDLLPHVERSDFSKAVIEEVEADPAATTLEFVVRAVPAGVSEPVRATEPSVEPAGVSTDELSRRAAVKRTTELERALAQVEALLARAQTDLERTRAVEAQPALEQRTALMAELEGTRRQASTSAAAAWRAQRQLGEAHARLDESRAQLDESRAQLAELEAALSNRSAVVSELESQRNDMVARIGELEGVNSSVTTQLEDARTYLVEKQAELDRNALAVAQLQAQAGSANARALALESQHAAGQELLSRAQTALERRTAAIVKLERTRAATQSQLDDAQTALERRTALTTELQRVLKEQRVRFLDLERFALLAVDESERRVADAEDAWFSLYAELHAERGRLTLAALTLKNREKSLADLQRELLATREQLQRRQRSDDDALADTRAELDASAAALRAGRERAAALAADVAVLKVRAAGAEQKLEDVATQLSAEVAILNVRLVKSENKAAELADELSRTSQQLTRLEQDLVEADRLVREREAGVSRALEHANRLEGELLRSSAHAQLRDTQLAETAQAVARLEDELRNAAEQAARLEDQRLDATAQVERLKDELVKTAGRAARLEEELAERSRIAAVLQNDLAETERRLLMQTEELCATTQAESAQLAMLIDTVQSSRFWKFKRWLQRFRSRAFGV